jgi:hypothetical protein
MSVLTRRTKFAACAVAMLSTASCVNNPLAPPHRLTAVEQMRNTLLTHPNISLGVVVFDISGHQEQLVCAIPSENGSSITEREKPDENFKMKYIQRGPRGLHYIWSSNDGNQSTVSSADISDDGKVTINGQPASKRIAEDIKAGAFAVTAHCDQAVETFEKTPAARFKEPITEESAGNQFVRLSVIGASYGMTDYRENTYRLLQGSATPLLTHQP